jgi:hypothetical protein
LGVNGLGPPLFPNSATDEIVSQLSIDMRVSSLWGLEK